jgi:hypothetical protein
MGTAQVIFAVVLCGGATGSHVTKNDGSHVTRSDGSHVTGSDPVRKYVLCMCNGSCAISTLVRAF